MLHDNDWSHPQAIYGAVADFAPSCTTTSEHMVLAAVDAGTVKIWTLPLGKTVGWAEVLLQTYDFEASPLPPTHHTVENPTPVTSKYGAAVAVAANADYMVACTKADGALMTVRQESLTYGAVSLLSARTEGQPTLVGTGSTTICAWIEQGGVLAMATLDEFIPKQGPINEPIKVPPGVEVAKPYDPDEARFPEDVSPSAHVKAYDKDGALRPPGNDPFRAAKEYDPNE